MSKLKIIRYKNKQTRRKIRTRARIMAESLLPRLSVFRSNKYLFAQIIDSKTGVSVTGVRGEKPAEVGKSIAEKSIKAGVTKVTFDRGSYKYHGRVKALAEAAREAGLKF